MKPSWKRVLLGLLAFATPIPAVAGVIIIYVNMWWSLPTRPSAPPNLSNADFAAATPLDSRDLRADMEAATGHQFKITGPVTVKSGNMGHGGFILSAPVTFAEAARATEDEKIGAYNIAKDSLWFRERFFGAEKTRVGMVDTWCGIAQTHGLFTLNTFICMGKRPDGNTDVYLGQMTVSVPAEYYPTGINRDSKLAESEKYPFPVLEPEASPPADMTLKLKVSANKIPGAHWALAKVGKNFDQYLYSNENLLFGPNFMVPYGDHYTYQMGQTTLAFDFDKPTKSVTVLGIVTPGANSPASRAGETVSTPAQ